MVCSTRGRMVLWCGVQYERLSGVMVWCAVREAEWCNGVWCLCELGDKGIVGRGQKGETGKDREEWKKGAVKREKKEE